MNIKSKDFVLMPRHLRKFNGSTIEMFGDQKGQLVYPYVMVSRNGKKYPISIENRKNFKLIHKVYKDRKVVAERVHRKSDLRSTGKG